MSFSILSAAEETPNGVALVVDGARVTFAELAERVHRRARAYAASGWLDSGAPIALLTRPSVATIECLLAAFAFGAPVLVLNARLPAAEVDELCGRAGALAVVDPELAASDARSLSFPSPRSTLDPELPLVLVPTSGSTGQRKLVALSRRAFDHSAAASAQNLPLTPSDRWLLCLPLAHVGGLSILTRSLRARSTIVLFTPESKGLLASAPRLARALNDEHVTVTSLVPALLDALLDTHPSWGCRSLRAALLGGAPATPTLLQRAQERALPVLTTYGLTEACSQVTTTSFGTVPRVRDGLVSSGRPLAGVDVAVDAAGRIRVRGPTLCSGYVGAPSPLDADGWWTTDDLGRIDELGELFVLGRSSDRIVTGGEKVDPALVEAALLYVPGVRSACVFGAPDPRFGEIVACALVVTPESFRAAAAEGALSDRLAPHELPRRVALLDALPLNASGKVDRARARALALPQLRRWADV